MENLILFAFLFVLFVIWAIAWPHVKLARQAKRLADLERRVEAAERALIVALETGAASGAEAAPTPAAAQKSDAGQPADQAKLRPAQTQGRSDERTDAETSARSEEAPSDPTAPDAPDAAQTSSERPDWRTNWAGAGMAEPSRQDARPKRAEPRANLEERLGAKWSVLVGGAALAIGALMLVRYTIEAGLIGPGARVLGGVALGLALIAAGEYARRREAPQLGRVSIPATLTAAGTIAIFGAIYAAHALYGFIGPATAFALLGATGVTTMAAAALHGPTLAGLGLIGSYATPLLISAREPSLWSLALYLIAVSAAAYGLARIRRWFALAGAALAGATIWQIGLGLHSTSAFHAPAIAHGLIQTALAIMAFAAPYFGAQARLREAVAANLAPLAIAAATSFAALVAPVDGGWSAHVTGGLALVAMLAAAGAFIEAAAALSAAAGLFALAFTAFWPASPSFRFDPPWPPPLTQPLEPDVFLRFAALAAAIVFGAAFARLHRADVDAHAGAVLGAAGAGTPVLLLAAAYVRMTGAEISGVFAMASGALAIVFTLVAASFGGRARESFDARQAMGFAALGALGALAVGLAAGLSGGSLTAAWGLTALAAAWLAARLDVTALRWGVAAMGALVAARLIWEPRVAHEISTTLVFNWLLIGYGVPALAFAGAARLMRGREDIPLQIARGLAIALAGFLFFLEIRHAMNGGDVYAQSHKLAEVGLQAFSATMFAIVLTKIGGASPPAVYRWATALAGALAALLAGVGLMFVANPYLSSEPLTRDGFFNELIPGYLLPAFGAAALAIVARPYSDVKARVAAAAALALVFMFVTLETRAQFHDLDLSRRLGVTEAESLTLSGVWLALGLATLAYGVLRRSKEARLGSAAFVLLATGKVFLFDLSDLTGAWRAFSFIGLGLALIGVGAVYQRLLFPRRASGEADEGDGPAL